MNDESFVGVVLNNASRYDIGTLEKIIHGLNDNIAGWRWGKPPGLKVGTNIEAILFDAPSFVQYGTVVRLSPKGCKIESPGSCRAACASNVSSHVRDRLWSKRRRLGNATLHGLRYNDNMLCMIDQSLHVATLAIRT